MNRPEEENRRLRLYLAILVIGLLIYLAYHGNLGHL